MTLVSPNPALPSFPNPYFQDNSFVRGDQQRANNGFIWNNLEDLDARLTIVENTNYLLNGSLVGGLSFNSTTLPPVINSGAYEINGKIVNLTSNASLALSDTIGSSLQTLDTYSQYLIVLDNTGSKKYIMYGEGAVVGASGNISGIVESPTGTFTMTKSTGTVSSYTNKVLVLLSGSTVLYSGKITGGDGSTTIVFKAPNAASFAGATTWAVYERIATLHGVGAATAITTDADVLKYSPSYGQNGFPAAIAGFSNSLGAYYLSLLGLTGYRVIGNFRTDGSGNVITDIISHKSGRDKNDNSWYVIRAASSVTNAVRFHTVKKMFGCDYIYIDNVSVGSEWSAQREALANLNFEASSSDTTTFASILVSQSSTNTFSDSSDEQVNILGYGVTGAYKYMVSNSSRVNVNTIMKPLIVNPVTVSGLVRFSGTLEL